MFCTKCGTQALEGARFCRVCGQAFPSPAVEPAETVPVAPNLEPLPATVSSEPVATMVEPPVTSYPPPLAPSAVPLHAPYAGFWLRFVAYLIDSAIVGVAFAAIVAVAIGTVGLRAFRGFVPGVYDRPTNPFFPVAMMGVIFVLLPITIVVSWLYFAYMESSVHQGTLGKMALGLFVTDTPGPESDLRARYRTIFRESYHRADSVFHRLHHGGIYGKAAGIARHDCRLPGAEESLDSLPTIAPRKRGRPLGFDCMLSARQNCQNRNADPWIAA